MSPSALILFLSKNIIFLFLCSYLTLLGSPQSCLLYVIAPGFIRSVDEMLY